MEGAEVGITLSPQDTQRRRDGAPAGRKDGAGEQEWNVRPSRTGEQIDELLRAGIASAAGADRKSRGDGSVASHR